MVFSLRVHVCDIYIYNEGYKYTDNNSLAVLHVLLVLLIGLNTVNAALKK